MDRTRRRPQCDCTSRSSDLNTVFRTALSSCFTFHWHTHSQLKVPPMSVTESTYNVTFDGEDQSNAVRQTIAHTEPHSLRTYTPSQVVIARSAGVYHWTPEGRQLYDFSSGVLVANLGHNPTRWLRTFQSHLGWNDVSAANSEFVPAAAMTAYNAVTELEADATSRLLQSLRSTELGSRLEVVMWSASGSEAVQKALWACMRRNPQSSPGSS